jgi:hypothetical protein
MRSPRDLENTPISVSSRRGRGALRTTGKKLSERRKGGGVLETKRGKKHFRSEGLILRVSCSPKQLSKIKNKTHSQVW